MTVDVEVNETTISSVLQNVQRGDRVRLLNRGVPVATVVPSRTEEPIVAARTALANMDARAERLGLRFDFEEFKADRNFGRK